MKSEERENHWNKVFLTKDTKEVSWYQKNPKTSVELINSLNLPLESKIVDVGCGDSFLADILLKNSYSDITLIDISEKAINTVKKRLEDRNHNVKFITTDIINFNPDQKFDIWHDRAVFHFLTQEEDIKKYVKITSENITTKGKLIIGTFSVDGPDKCSGLDVNQYSKEKMEEVFKGNFKIMDSFYIDHITPSGSVQNFLFCVFERINNE